jgi:uncharacterized protein YbjT (DUF2867 family)
MKILIFGATGSAGGSVLRACLASPAVEEVRAIARRPLSLTDPKLRVIVHGDYLDYSKIEDAFAEVDACLFCLGISATQVRARRSTAGSLTISRSPPPAPCGPAAPGPRSTSSAARARTWKAASCGRG